MADLGTIVAASPLDANDGVRYTGFVADTAATASFALGDTPADFLSMDQVSWNYDGRESINGGDDTLTISARVVNGGTILAANDSGGTFQTIYTKTGSFSTTDVTRGPSGFFYVNTAASKATWDGAVVEIQYSRSQNMGPDGVRPEPDWFALTGTYTQDISSDYDQASFRFRNDDGSETAATWKAAENTDVQIPLDTPFRIRFAIDETTANGVDEDFRLQYRRNAGAWTNAGSTQPVGPAASTHVTNEEATTRQLTGGTGTFSPGIVEEGDCVVLTAIPVDPGDVTEIEFVVQLISANGAAEGDTIDLRVVHFSDATILASYSVADATITVPAPITTEVGSRYSVNNMGPWLAPNGSHYLLAKDDVFFDNYWIKKYNTGTETWDIVGTLTPSSGSASNVGGPVNLDEFGSKIPIGYWDGADWRYACFDTATDTFTITDEFIQTLSANSTSRLQPTVAGFSDGRPIIAYTDFTVYDIHLSVRSSLDGAGTWSNYAITHTHTSRLDGVGLVVDTATDIAHAIAIDSTGGNFDIVYGTLTSGGTVATHTQQVIAGLKTMVWYNQVTRLWIDGGRLYALIDDPDNGVNRTFSKLIRTDQLGAGAVWTDEGRINSTEVYGWDPDLENPVHAGAMAVLVTNPNGADVVYRVGAKQNSGEIIATEWLGGTSWDTDQLIYTMKGVVRSGTTLKCPQLSVHGWVDGSGDIWIAGFIGEGSDEPVAETFIVNLGAAPSAGPQTKIIGTATETETANPVQAPQEQIISVGTATETETADGVKSKRFGNIPRKNNNSVDGTTTATVQLTGTPSNGNLLVFALAWENNNGDADVTPHTGAVLATDGVTKAHLYDGTALLGVTIYWKEAVDEGTDPTYTFTAANLGKYVLTVQEVEGPWDFTNLISEAANNSEFGVSDTLHSTGTTDPIPQAAAYAVGAIGTGDLAGGFSGWTNNYVEQHDRDAPGAGDLHSLGVADKVLETLAGQETSVTTGNSVIAGGAIAVFNGVNQVIPVGTATETETAVNVGLAQTVIIGTATETETANEINTVASVLIGVATETESAGTVNSVKGAVTVPVGTATETETANIVDSLQEQIVAVGTATETESANPITATAGTATIAVATASETETANPISVVSGVVSVSVSVATETETANTVTVSQGAAPQTIPVGTATETETANGIAVITSVAIAVGTASEAESANAVAVSTAITIPVSVAAETESANSIAVIQDQFIAIGVATETETAEIVNVNQESAPQSRLIGTATETEAASAVDVTAGAVSASIGTATETETANIVGVGQASAPQTIAVGVATETESANGVAVLTSVAVQVSVATESETANAVAVGSTISISVGVASETESAVSIAPTVGSISVGVGVATETESANTVGSGQSSPPQIISVGTAVETETAGTVIVIPGVALIAVSTATEFETAGVVTVVEGGVAIFVGTATEVESANEVFVNQAGAPQTRPIGTASETESANAIDIAADQFVAINVATETETANSTPVETSYTATIGTATEAETATTISAIPGGVSVGVTAALETESAGAIASGGAVSVSIGTATEVESANVIVVDTITTVSIGTATELESATAVGLLAPISVAVGVASETETANSVTGLGTIPEIVHGGVILASSGLHNAIVDNAGLRGVRIG